MAVGTETIVHNWLKEMKIPASKSYIRQQLLSHPDYPSLLSITDTLDELGIENAAIRIEKDKLQDMPLPFLAHLNGNGGAFAMVNTRDKLENQLPGFFDCWDGVAVAAEKSENWHSKSNNEWLRKDKKQLVNVAVILLLLTTFVLLAGAVSLSWMQTGLLLVAIAGVFISWMTVSKELGIENKIADKVCGSNTDCSSVIHSSVGKLPLGIVWSDAGIVYFTFLLMMLVISSFTGNSRQLYILLSIPAVCALPVTLLSVWYQWRVIKKWCRLCLITVTLLWLQFIVLLPQINTLLKGGLNKTSITYVPVAIFILFFVTAFWLWLKPLLKKNRELETENFAAKRFRNNLDVFTALLEKQKKLTVNPEGLGIILGNHRGENTIIKVCNPYCGPCAKAHHVIEWLLEENKNLQVQIIFTADDDEKDIKTKPVKHLMALYEKDNGGLIQKALDDWYLADKRDYDAFAGKYILNGELDRQGEKLKAMKRWCDEVKIEFTPTFFVNGFQLPKQYKIEELKYFLS